VTTTTASEAAAAVVARVLMEVVSKTAVTIYVRADRVAHWRDRRAGCHPAVVVRLT